MILHLGACKISRFFHFPHRVSNSLVNHQIVKPVTISYLPPPKMDFLEISWSMILRLGRTSNPIVWLGESVNRAKFWFMVLINSIRNGGKNVVLEQWTMPSSA